MSSDKKGKEYIEFEEYFEGNSNNEEPENDNITKQSLIDNFHSKVNEIKIRVNPNNTSNKNEPVFKQNHKENEERKNLFRTELNKDVEVLKFDKVMGDSLNKGNEEIEKEESDDYEENQDRIEMENEFNIAKDINELKENNQRLEKVIKYQNMKIDSLESEIEKLINENNNKDIELEELRGKGKTPNNEFKKMMTQINTLTSQVEKIKKQFNDKVSEYNALLERNNSVQKSLDEYILSEKKMKQEIINKDKRIARLIEELDKKETPSNQKNNLNNDKEIDRLKNEVKKIEKQKNDIYAAFKKSLKLCSILKRQKIHLENARLLNFTEEEFKQLLEQNKI